MKIKKQAQVITEENEEETSNQQDSIPEVQTYADLIVNYLIQLDVDYLFGVPGGAIEPLYNAVGRHLKARNCPSLQTNPSIVPLRQRRSSHGIKPIVARHEAGAAYMADGYARETGKLGVCCATTGPGATNLITGVASAYADRIPMLVITPQTALPDFGKMGLQESSMDAIDIVAMFEQCTRYNTLVSHPDQLEGKLYNALINAYRHPRGPVHLSIPMDIMNTPINKSSMGYPVAHLFRQMETVDENTYAHLIDTIFNSKKIVLFVGGGSKTAINHITQFADMVDAEIVSTPSGKRWMNSYNPRYKGVFGFAGHPSAMETVMQEDVDMILAVGTCLGELSTSGWNESLLNYKLAHIAQTPEDFARSPMAGLHVLGDIRCIFKHLTSDLSILNKMEIPAVKHFDAPIIEDKPQYLPNNLKLHNPNSIRSESAPLKPQRVMKELAERLPKDTRYICDAGNSWAWVTHYLMNRALNTQRVGFGFGAMGWAVGASIGTALGNHNHPVVCITGDGSYLMSGQEITVAVQEKIPVIYIVLNDQALGMVKHGQRMTGAERICHDLPPVDFAMMAKSVGANGFTIKCPADFAKLNINKMLNDNKPSLLDIYIDPEETPPMGARVKTLNRGNKTE